MVGWGPLGSLREVRNPDTSGHVERPHTRTRGHGAGREDLSCEGDFPLGLPGDEVYGPAAVPWNEGGPCGLLKEIPAVPLLISRPK